MAAHHHINPNQLALFVDPEEHIARMQHSTDTGGGAVPMHQMWERKEEESMEPEGYGHGAGLYERLHPDIGGEQVRNPVHVWLGRTPAEDKQFEGHHRIAASAAIQRETGEKRYVPVQYDPHGMPGWTPGPQFKRSAPSWKPVSPRSESRPRRGLLGTGTKEAINKQFGGRLPMPPTGKARRWGIPSGPRFQGES
jgi:hypothetical protein